MSNFCIRFIGGMLFFFCSFSMLFSQEADIVPIPVAGDDPENNACDRIAILGAIEHLSSNFLGDWWQGPPMTLMGERHEIVSRAFVENYKIKKSDFRHVVDIFGYMPLPTGGLIMFNVPFVENSKSVDDFSLGKCGVKNTSNLSPTIHLRPGVYSLLSTVMKEEIVTITTIDDQGVVTEEDVETLIILDSLSEELRVMRRNWT